MSISKKMTKIAAPLVMATTVAGCSGETTIPTSEARSSVGTVQQEVRTAKYAQFSLNHVDVPGFPNPYQSFLKADVMPEVTAAYNMTDSTGAPQGALLKWKAGACEYDAYNYGFPPLTDGGNTGPAKASDVANLTSMSKGPQLNTQVPPPGGFSQLFITAGGKPGIETNANFTIAGVAPGQIAVEGFFGHHVQTSNLLKPDMSPGGVAINFEKAAGVLCKIEINNVAAPFFSDASVNYSIPPKHTRDTYTLTPVPLMKVTP